MKQILVVEDDPDIQTQMKWGLSKEYNVFQASDRPSANRLFNKKKPLVVTLDLGLPPDENDANEGLSCLRDILKKAPETKVIILTGNNDRENARKAIQMGAYDYYLKPVDMNELKVILKRAFYLSEIESENRKLHMILHREAGFAGMIGQSPEMLRVFETIRKVASTDAAILIMGESGTGKELVARAIHEKSTRNQGGFIPINCGAIPGTLLESELFGYEKGAFTGAYAKQNGKFEYADRGTLFLDEIGEMSPELQAKLLRFLQEKKIQRLGGRKDIEIDTRVITATNIDLNRAMQEGRFREDLFFRISVISINIPPLRERGFDIKLLANTFLERYKVMFKKKIKGFSRSAADELERYLWPGNVRELENKVQKAVITADSNVIGPYDLGLDAQPEEVVRGGRPGKRCKEVTLKEARKRLEIDLIANAVERHNGNIKRASAELGISRPTLYDLIDKYKLPVKDNAK
ncbi:MAG TPA: PEP-CTERM-box response regulator transcription factor [Nitrospirae bacterium]|nr:transcriptional regulatory protein ZraR [bacterium BMS3Abin06]HDH11129.1 PEP-CTERM-box response regulator transcription factor [Nitrospirota bacterium]HDZ02530.1 PEP-CTERM-box response regulator transcription factor [Nitrospirota bacterium]